jgi:hypothetical protein
VMQRASDVGIHRVQAAQDVIHAGAALGGSFGAFGFGGHG